MKPINELVGQAANNLTAPSTKQQQTPSKSEPPRRRIKPLPESQISQLFRILKTEYGSAFTSQFDGGDVEKDLALAKGLWAKRLYDCTQAEIGYGLAEMPSKFVRYPPNVHEFHALCKSYRLMKQAQNLWQGIEHKDGKIIDKDTIKKDMAGLRKMLGQPTGEEND